MDRKRKDGGGSRSKRAEPKAAETESGVRRPVGRLQDAADQTWVMKETTPRAGGVHLLWRPAHDAWAAGTDERIDLVDPSDELGPSAAQGGVIAGRYGH
jgi:hypothetical protein